MEIEEKNTEKMQTACIFHKGPVEEMPTLLMEIMEYEMKKGLEMAGAPFAAYYSSPEEVAPDEWEYEVGIPFAGEAQDEGRIKIKNFPSQKVLSTIHKGPYQEIEPVYIALMQYVIDNDYEVVGAPMEFYLNSPMEVSESELLTEVQFPVAK